MCLTYFSVSVGTIFEELSREKINSTSLGILKTRIRTSSCTANIPTVSKLGHDKRNPVHKAKVEKEMHATFTFLLITSWQPPGILSNVIQ